MCGRLSMAASVAVCVDACVERAECVGGGSPQLSSRIAICLSRLIPPLVGFCYDVVWALTLGGGATCACVLCVRRQVSKEFKDFVTAIGECKSKQEEDRIILKEM